MATKKKKGVPGYNWLETFKVIGVGTGIIVLVFLGLYHFTVINPIEQTEQHLNCREDSPRMVLIAPANVYPSNGMKWSTITGPMGAFTLLPAGSKVCLVAYDDWNARYVQVVFPNPQGMGREGEFTRGWVELETLPLEARDAPLSISNPWQTTSYP